MKYSEAPQDGAVIDVEQVHEQSNDVQPILFCFLQKRLCMISHLRNKKHNDGPSMRLLSCFHNMWCRWQTAYYQIIEVTQMTQRRGRLWESVDVTL